MASIVLFHSALGLTAGVRRFAGALIGDGHTVLTPDLFDGQTFRTVEEGVQKRDALGIPELMRRAAAAVEMTPLDSIYAGFSMGAAAAQYLALSRPGARALVLMHAVLPLAALGGAEWPRVPVQIHASEADPGSMTSSLPTSPAPRRRPSSATRAKAISSPTKITPTTTRQAPAFSSDVFANSFVS